MLRVGVSSGGGGPPFVTDDPEPVEDGHYEINIAAIGLTERSGTASPAPMIDANWGAAPDLQLHVGLGLAYAEADGGVRAGYGDTELGIKYRFLHQDPEGWLPDVAFYPNIELPTGDAARGLGAGHVQLLLPIWIEKDWDRWSSYGGGGFWSNHHGADRNNWFVGWVLLRQITDSLQLGGEIYRQDVGGRGPIRHDRVQSRRHAGAERQRPSPVFPPAAASTIPTRMTGCPSISAISLPSDGRAAWRHAPRRS